MIVCLSGAHSTGKSTLVNQFRNQEGFQCIDSVTRTVISSEERRIDKGVSEKGQLEIAKAIQKRTSEIVEMNSKDPSQVYLLDRCVFDFLAYSKAFVERGQISKECYETLQSEVEYCADQYDLVIKIPIQFEIVDDGIRSVDTELQERVDFHINELMNRKVALDKSYQVYFLQEFYLNDRVQRIRNLISNARTL